MGSVIFYIWVAVAGAGAVTVFGLNLRDWKRNAPMRQQVRGLPITFRTDLSLINLPDSSPQPFPSEIALQPFPPEILRRCAASAGRIDGKL